MASKRRPLELNSASIIGLKAELYRKRAEVKEAQNQPKSFPQRPKKLPVWARSREKTEKARTERDAASEKAAEESALLARSRQMLEAKSRLYEELTQSSLPPTDPDDESGYLVDFERKTLEKNCDESERRLGASEATEEGEEEEVEKEEDWVEYLDVFGRSRRCLREDLPHHLQRNDELREDLSRKAEQENDGEEEVEEEGEEEVVVLPRERTETVEPERRTKAKLHYADVQENEVRSHGVGFFQFSTDEATRQAQLKELQQMRTKTEAGRERRERIKAKRKAQLELRLAKVKERRKLTGEETQAVAESGESKNDEDAIAATLAELRAQAEQCREKHERNNPLFPRREWDRGKAMMSAEKYLEKRRTERQTEFAPPSSYAR